MATSNKAAPVRVFKDLEAENKALQARLAALEAAQASGIKQTVITIGEWQGKPTLSFEGSFRPFHIGMSKAKAIADNIETVRKFIKSNGKSI